MHRHWKLVGFIALALAMPACRTVLNADKSFDLGPGEKNTLTIDAASKEQRIKVEVTSTAAPVNVYVFLEKDQQAAETDIRAKKQSSKVLASQEKTEGVTLEPTIPAGNPTVVLVTSASSSKTAKVRVKITN
jgi:hypothetical protein